MTHAKPPKPDFSGSAEAHTKRPNERLTVLYAAKSQPKFVAYLRVSTKEQERSGLGLEAQKNAIQNFATASRTTISRSFIEIESGASNGRPVLKEALRTARITGASLVIAKLDRLSRNAGFLLALRDSGVRFIAVDMPDANNLTVGIMALVAEQEREAISTRTRDALAAARRRGIKLGNPNGALALRRANRGNQASLRSIVQSADARALDLKPILEDLRLAGCVTFLQLAEALNERGVLTARSRRWHPSSVSNLINRISRHQSNP